MKNKQIIIFLCSLLMFFTVPVYAKETRYTVRIYSGAQGTIEGKEVKEYTDLPYGAEVRFNLKDVQLKDNSKYYIKGIRESGRDNNTVSELSTVVVNRDIDYVVAYGILGNVAEYHVRYLDSDGREILPTETYYGNVGDKPVIAYHYIDGYFPHAKNLTGTLKKKGNDFVFYYQKKEKKKEKSKEDKKSSDNRKDTESNSSESSQKDNKKEESKTRSTQGTTQESTSTQNTGTTQATQTTQPTQANPTEQTTQDQTQTNTENNTQSGNDSTETSETGTSEQPDQSTEAPSTQTLPETEKDVPEIIDVDDNKTPLAEKEGNQNNVEDWVIPGALLAIILFLVAIVAIVFWRRKEEENATKDDSSSPPESVSGDPQDETSENTDNNSDKQTKESIIKEKNTENKEESKE